MPSCPIIGSTNATALVNSGWQWFNQQATQFNNLAVGLIGALRDYSVDPLTFNIQLAVPTSPVPFIAPDAPTPPDLVFREVAAPPPPPSAGIGQINFAPIPKTTFGSAPTALAQRPNITAPTPNFGSAPDELTITLPTPPTLNNPTAPTLQTITLPTAPVLSLPVWDLVQPQVDFVVPNLGIQFNPQPYASTSLTDIQTKLQLMRNGQLVLPYPVYNAMFARARAREDMLASKAVQEAFEDGANRGFSIPPGSVSGRVMEVRQDNQNKVSSLSRDIFVQEQTELLKSIRDAITEGIQLEGKQMDTYMQLQNLQLQSQKAMLDAAVSIFNAQVTLFNAKQQAFGIAAQVKRDQIQAALAQVQIYQTQLEAEKVKEEINKDLIAIYEAQIRAVLALVEEYKAQIDAQKAISDIDRNRVERFRALISAFSEEVKAYGIQWDAYRADVDGDLGRARVFESQINGFATLVRATADGNNNLIAQGQLSLESQKANLLAWRGLLDRFIAEVQAERDRISSGTQVFDGEARIYSAAGSIAEAESNANTRSFQAVLEAARAQVDVLLKNAEMKIQQVVQLSNQKVEALRGAAQTTGQLGAGAMSAVQFGARAEDSNHLSNSVTCATDYRFTGQL